MDNRVEIFDTTLRDGLQVEGVSATVEDKLRIAEQLDYLGVHFIEGGWPGANPKDIEFFARAARAARSTTTPPCRTCSTPARPRYASSPRARSTTSPKRCRRHSTRGRR